MALLLNVSAGGMDSDGDGISDEQDNCILIANPLQQDSNLDGLGNACDADIAPSEANDCVVNFIDVIAISAAFFSTPATPNWNPDADFDGSGSVNFIDFGILTNSFLAVPGPSAVGNACTDNDNDGFTSETDCDDNDPLSFPGAPEQCDGADNNCNLMIDEGIPTDGASCADPGPPDFGAVIDTLHIVALTGPDVDDGTNGNGISVCLTATNCWIMDNDNFNDLERSAYDVFSFEGVDFPRELVDRVEIRSVNGTDKWVPACVQINFDGEPVYCENLAGITFGSEPGQFQSWSDPAGLHLGCQACNAAPLTHGPMIGAVTESSAKLWARTDSTRRVELRVSTSEQDLAAAVPVAVRYPLADKDFTSTIDVLGLEPNTEYFYSFESEAGETVVNSFSTSPLPGAATQMRFGFGSSARLDNQPIFNEIDALDPDLFVFAGDTHYGNTNDLSDLRRFYQWGLDSSFSIDGAGRSGRAALAQQTPTIATWDDHDFTGENDDGSAAGKDVALRVFKEFWANPGFGEPDNDGVYFRHQYGDVEFFVIDDRYYRSFPDSDSLLGSQQTQWLKNALLSSTATFKIMVSGSQWTTEGNGESWAAFRSAQRALFQYIADNQIEGVVVLSGDAKRSELRRIPGGVGGYTVPEVVSSPLSVAPADPSCGLSNELVACEDSGNYFIMVDVDTTLSDPSLIANIHDENGMVLSTLTVTASELKNPAPGNSDDLPDFNGDGYADIVIGASFEDLGDTNAAGVFHVLYGTSQGLHSLNDDFWHQDRAGIAGGAEDYDNFGDALATGDFNGDGYTDVAAGVPGESIGSVIGSGGVNVLYGSAAGLTASGDQFWSQGSDGVNCCSADTNDNFGAVLATGRFNNDSFDDLAVGVPGENNASGGVVIFYGSSGGLNTSGLQGYTQNNIGPGTAPENLDRFGASLTTGDYNGDNIDDLVIGAPDEEVLGVDYAGIITVVYGTNSGLSSSGVTTWHQNTLGGVSSLGDSDRFSYALASGDFDGDGYEDLVVGAPGEEVDSVSDSGSINVMYGSATGVNGTGDQVFNTKSPGIDLPTLAGDLGWALKAGDFNNDGYYDLAIGSPDYNQSRGIVLVLYGSIDGLSTEGSDVWEQDLLSGSVSETIDRFGRALSVGDYNADGFTDLAVGSPGEKINGFSLAGQVNILYGSMSGLSADGSQFWHQNVDGVAGGSEERDIFGNSMP